jgi:hypothetical protein
MLKRMTCRELSRMAHEYEDSLSGADREVSDERWT